MTEPDFELFTSLRYDPKLSGVPGTGTKGLDRGWNASKSSPLYMLDYHRDRMLRAATYFGWTDAIAAIDGDAGLARLEAFILGLPEVGDHPLRVKVTLSKAGQFGHEAGQVPEKSLSNLLPPSLPPPGQGAFEGGVVKSPTYKIVVDLDQTPPSEYTHYKTTKRDMYNSARQRMGIGATDTAEVLLVNTSDGSIMEGSLATPYFWRNGRWVTPPVPTRFSREQGGGQDGTTRRWALERGLCVEESVEASSLVEGEECWISSGVRGFNFGKVALAK
ncbi:hypothetical protein MCOR25_009977 [Pyricularia grisea]|nr:hypothetical protein MCOR25_009977 [Pyricularia grisea]